MTVGVRIDYWPPPDVAKGNHMKVLRNALFATGTLALLIAALVALSPQSPHPSATHPDYSGTKAEAAASSSLASGPSWDAPATPLPGPAFDALSDDPRTKEAAVAFVLPGPPPAAEVRDAPTHTSSRTGTRCLDR